MSISYNNSKKKENNITEIEQIENQNGSINVAIIARDEISTLNAVAEEFKTWRHKLQSIINQMRQASNLDTLMQVTVGQVREKINCDRVLIYRFDTQELGTVLAESQTLGWTPTFEENLPGIIFGLSTAQEYVEPLVINDISQIEVTPYQQQLLEKFQIKASLSLPIVVDNKIWGLLVANNCTSMRQWQEGEITLLSQIAAEFVYRFQKLEFVAEEAQETLIQKSVNQVINKITQVSDIARIFQLTTQEIRQIVKCDRISVYRFNPDWSGEFIAESVGNGWGKMVGPDLKTVWEDTYLQSTQGGRYARGESLAVNDIHKADHSPCHVDILVQFEIRAYLTAPIFFKNKLWGVLAAYQHSAPREWHNWEIKFLEQIGLQYSIVISQVDYINQTRLQVEKLAQIAEQEKAFTKIANRIRQAANVQRIFETTTQEIRQLLRCDRVAIYRFNPDWSGEFISESVGFGWVKVVGNDNIYVWKDTCLMEMQGGHYAKGESSVVNDIYNAGFSPCYVEMLEIYETRAYIIVPIFFGDKLWGLLAAYQNSAPREWQPWESNFLNQIGLQLSLAKAQLEYLEQLRLKSDKISQIAEQEKGFTKIINRIRQSSNFKDIFKVVTQEVRDLLKCDRGSIYRFNSDYSGDFVAESVANGWVKLVGSDNKIFWEDTYLHENEGGRYAKGETSAVHDIYQVGFSPCHIEVLEKFQARAYIIVPIFLGQNLWGLLAAYQNTGPRDWQDSEVSLLTRVSDQLALGLQQTEYLQQLQAQSTELKEAAGREKAAKELLQQRCIQLLIAVRPALNGDLTVRAPITEDELGTIADAYNNTLQALRKIVIQVQEAAEQVAQTSSNSNTSLHGLTDVAKQQSEEITIALREIQQMLDSSQAVVANTELVRVAVQQANQTVESGDAAMNLTVKAIQGIRETVAQTSKKIKRLSESSQKISKVVNLISNFATQTNVLALNAAIEATRAGEYGKGFAVVADEVRSLSRQSAAATIEIEKLVQEIQAETGEVAVAMETGIQQVVEGTNLVSDARQNLNAIVNATAEISQLLQQITAATHQQMTQSVTVTSTMKEVAEISDKTVNQSYEIAAVFQQLSGMAQELLVTASQFKVN